MFTITWNDQNLRSQTVAEVDEVLNRLHEQFRQKDPTLVTVELAATGDSLALGLGRELSVLSYVRGDKNPPYLGSKGGAHGEETIEFRFGGQWSEFSIRNTVAIGLAREAVRYFCESGKLSEIIEWEEV